MRRHLGGGSENRKQSREILAIKKDGEKVLSSSLRVLQENYVVYRLNKYPATSYAGTLARSIPRFRLAPASEDRSSYSLARPI